MQRRDLLKASFSMGSAAGIASLFATGTALTAGVANAASAEHAGHHMMMPASPALLAALADCIQEGQACLAHCIMMMGDGDKTMADCARSTQDTVALCTALQSLVAAGSHKQHRLAGLVADACQECADTCRKHADKHEVCKRCAEACEACLKECKKIAG